MNVRASTESSPWPGCALLACHRPAPQRAVVRIGGALACGHEAWVEARSADERTVTLALLSHCPVLEQLAETLRQASPVDAYEEAGDPGASLLLQAVGRLLLECPDCRVGVDVYRALYSASGLLS